MLDTTHPFFWLQHGLPSAPRDLGIPLHAGNPASCLARPFHKWNNGLAPAVPDLGPSAHTITTSPSVRHCASGSVEHGRLRVCHVITPLFEDGFVASSDQQQATTSRGGECDSRCRVGPYTFCPVISSDVPSPALPGSGFTTTYYVIAPGALLRLPLHRGRCIRT